MRGAPGTLCCTDEGLERFLASKAVIALTVGDLQAHHAFSAAFRRVGATAAFDKRGIEKSITAELQRVNGTGPKIAKEMLRALTVRDDEAPVVVGKMGPEPDPNLRDTEDVPLGEEIPAYFDREVLPYVPDAWVDEKKTRIGYEIPFTRHFYQYVPPRPLAEIDADIVQLDREIQDS